MYSLHLSWGVILVPHILKVVDGELSTCTGPKQDGMKFSITSSRNQTGHWIAKVSMQHDARESVGEDKEAGPWEIELDHSTSSCEDKETIRILAHIIAPPKRPGSDYELVPGLGYYKFHVTPLSWEEARLTCYREGAHLAILNSETENGVLKRLFAKFPSFETESPLNTQAYLGVNDILVEGHFVTVFGTPLSSVGYAPWLAGEPSGGTEDCVVLSRTGLLNDVPCDIELPFFCEQEAWYHISAMTSRILVLAILTWCLAGSSGRPQVSVLKRKSPCSQANLRVEGRNSEAGIWAVRLGRLQAAVEHHAEGGLPTGSSDEEGDWEAFVYHHDEDCDDTLDPEQGGEGGGTSDSPSARPVDPTYDYDENGQGYKLHNETKPYDNATDVCASEDAYIAIINSREELEHLRKLFGLYPHIDDNNIINNQAFVSDGRSIDLTDFQDFSPERDLGYIEWAPGQPDNFMEDEYCLSLLREGGMNDVPCWLELPFFCEKNL
uniref:C-type lectin domain-containing protein n=1 Tax=Timema poppense TaxID=170557 RepID=A0A7R9CWI5_TIMPO|nr:unnamed protein product [Timema poppensis]